MVACESSIPAPTSQSRQGRALGLSVALHGLAVLLWFLVPPPTRLEAEPGSLLVDLLEEAPAKPEPPAPPPQPQPPKQQIKPAAAKPIHSKAPPKAAPTAKQSPAPTLEAAAVPAPTLPTATDSAATESSAETTSATVAAQAASSAMGAPASAGVPGSQGVDRDQYLRQLWGRIMRYRPDRVPFAGTARLRFTLGPDGHLLSAEIAESSGSGVLDRAVLDAVHRADPFPPPPANLAVDGLVFEVPFRFR